MVRLVFISMYKKGLMLFIVATLAACAGNATNLPECNSDASEEGSASVRAETVSKDKLLDAVKLVVTEHGKVDFVAKPVIFSDGKISIEIQNETTKSISVYERDFFFRIHGVNDSELLTLPGVIPLSEAHCNLDDKKKCNFVADIEQGINKKVVLSTGWYLVDIVWRDRETETTSSFRTSIRIVKDDSEVSPFSLTYKYNDRDTLSSSEVAALAHDVMHKKTTYKVSSTVCRYLLDKRTTRENLREICSEVSQNRNVPEETRKEEAIYYVTIGVAEYMQDLLDSPCYVIASGELDAFLSRREDVLSEISFCDKEISKWLVRSIVGTECIKNISDGEDALYTEYVGERINARKAISNTFGLSQIDCQCQTEMEKNHAQLWNSVESIINGRDGWINYDKDKKAIKFKFEIGLKKDDQQIVAARPIWKILKQ